MTLFFYKVQDPYGCFSNFSPHRIILDGLEWPTSEHYYQAQKFVGTHQADLCEQIRGAATPEQAAALGRNPAHQVRPDWDAVKQDLMYKAVKEKFLTHPEIRNTLLNTHHHTIIENSPTDPYWGCGADQSGMNYLGKILMRIRQELRDEYPNEVGDSDTNYH